MQNLQPSLEERRPENKPSAPIVENRAIENPPVLKLQQSEEEFWQEWFEAVFLK